MVATSGQGGQYLIPGRAIRALSGMTLGGKRSRLGRLSGCISFIGQQTGWNTINLPGGVGGHDDHPLHKISDFPDISGPAVVLNVLQHLIGETLLQIILLAEVVEKMQTKGNDVLLTLPHRRDGQRDDMDAVVQILTESALAHHFLQILIGGGDQAKIHLLGPGGANPLDALFLQTAQQLALYTHRERIEFVKKQGAAVGSLHEASLALPIGAGKAPLLIAEQFRLNQILRKSGAVDGDERLVFPAAVFVNIMGDDLFSAAGLPINQHGGIQGCDTVGHRKHLPEFRTLGNDADLFRLAYFFGFEDFVIIEQGVIQVLEVLDILQCGDDILHVALTVEDRRADDDTHPGGTVHLLEILVVLQTADPALFPADQVKHGHVQNMAEVMDVHFQVFLPGNVPPVDHDGVHENEVSLCIVEGDPGVDIIQNFCKGKFLTQLLKRRKILHLIMPPIVSKVVHIISQ